MASATDSLLPDVPTEEPSNDNASLSEVKIEGMSNPKMDITGDGLPANPDSESKDEEKPSPDPAPNEQAAGDDNSNAKNVAKKKSSEALETPVSSRPVSPVAPHSVASSEDVGRMLDALSSSSKMSFKEGFFSSDSDADLNRHRWNRVEVEGYHRKEDFPHMRHLMALQANHHKHRHHHHHKHRQKKHSVFVSPTASPVDVPMPSAVSEPLISPSQAAESPQVVVHTMGPSTDSLNGIGKTVSSEGVQFFVGDELEAANQGSRPKLASRSDSIEAANKEPVKPLKPVSPKPSIIRDGSKVNKQHASGEHVRFMLGSMSSMESSTPSIKQSKTPTSVQPSASATSMDSVTGNRPHYHHMHVPSQEELAQRRQPGSKTKSKKKKVPTATLR